MPKDKQKQKSMAAILAKASKLYEDTGEYDAAEESELRDELVLWADYAESGPTFDSAGKYLCGSCDMRLDTDDCMRVVSPISFKTGSCRIYTKGKPEDGEPMPLKLTQIESAYTERPHVKGFGCERCMYGGAAKKEDADGRKGWCSFWGVHVLPTACCFKNTGDDDVYAPVKGNGKSNKTETTMKTTASRAQNEVQIFCPLVKVDVAKREVWGVVTAEVPDKENEICDFETTAPYYKEVVSEMSKATDGANIFPLRAMHGLTAAGKGISIEFRKAEKEIYMGFKVVDDAEWKKVEENVYTGFSQGGRYIKKWKDGDFVRYTARPGEVSLVDMPCLTRAHFDYVKADGTTEVRKFAKDGVLPNSPTAVSDQNTSSVDNAACPCGCTYCAGGNCASCGAETKCNMSAKAVKYLISDSKTGKGLFPYTKADGSLDFKQMSKAWSALNEGFKGAKYEGEGKTAALKLLKRTYAKEGIDNPSEKTPRIEEALKTVLTDCIQNRAYGQLGKGMYTVGNFARILEDMKYLWMSMEYEREYEMDESPATDELSDIFMSMLDNFLAYTEEQVKEEKSRATAMFA